MGGGVAPTRNPGEFHIARRLFRRKQVVPQCVGVVRVVVSLVFHSRRVSTDHNTLVVLRPYRAFTLP